MDFRAVSNIIWRLTEFNNLNQSFTEHDITSTFAFHKSALRVLHKMHWLLSVYLSVYFSFHFHAGISQNCPNDWVISVSFSKQTSREVLKMS